MDGAKHDTCAEMRSTIVKSGQQPVISAYLHVAKVRAHTYRGAWMQQIPSHPANPLSLIWLSSCRCLGPTLTSLGQKPARSAEGPTNLAAQRRGRPVKCSACNVRSNGRAPPSRKIKAPINFPWNGAPKLRSSAPISTLPRTPQPCYNGPSRLPRAPCAPLPIWAPPASSASSRAPPPALSSSRSR